MRSLTFCALALLLGGAAIADTTGAKRSANLIPPFDADDLAGWVKLFNGKDLSGWRVNQGGNLKVWGAEDGVLFVNGGGGGWLMTDKEYADFAVKLEFKLTRHGNSGVALRSPLAGDPAYVGMEIQILDDPSYKGLQPWQHTGSIYGVVPPAKQVNRPVGEWNKMFVAAKGRRVVVAVNGTKLVDANLDDHVKQHAKHHPGLLRRTGHVGLQSHTDRVEFRNIYLKPL